jgi:hypothetical protein
MRIRTTFLVFTILICQLASAQSINKITGPLSVYHVSPGYCYNDSAGTDSILVQSQFKFGELAFSNQSIDNGFGFVPEIDSCVSWRPNRIFGIIQPPTEHGVYNQTADTALYAPYPQLNGPGMIQGGQRFSQLSQLYGGFSGVILDDWNGDTGITHQVRDAVRGKYVDAAGNVCSECTAATPYNKLITVLYGTGPNPAALPVMDGLFYSLFSGQNCCYTNLDNDINTLRTNWPHKEIMFCIFIDNTNLGWTDPVGVHYLLAHALDRYDDGDINAVNFFAGVFLDKNYMSLSLWDSLALPHWLDSLYFPYLGVGQGNIYDCNTRNLLTGANVHVYCKGKVSGDTLLRSNQKTDANGYYQFGLWAGNRNTDSTYYWIIAEKAGYITDTVGFWIKRNDTTNIPRISLCPGITGSKDYMALYPNPTNGHLTVEVEEEALNGTELDVYDMLGRDVCSVALTSPNSQINLTGLPTGIYLVTVSQSWGWVIIGRKRILIVR